MIRSRRWLAAVAVLGMVAAGCSSAPKKARRSPAPPPPLYQPSAYESFWIQAGSSADSRLCNGVAWEWFRFELREKSNVAVDLAMGGSSGDLDLYLYDDRVVLTSPVEEPIAISRSSSQREEHIRKELNPGIYYVKVHCFGNAREASVPYRLMVSVTGVGPIDEPIRQAYPVRESSKGMIGIGYKYRSRWYMPTFAGPGTLVLEFRPTMQRGELRFDVLTPDGVLLGSATSATAARTLRVKVAAGPHYFRLEPTTPDATGAFAFNFVVQPAPKPSRETERSDQKSASKRTPVQPREPQRATAPPAPVEAPRSKARRLPAKGSTRVTLGGTEPVARWYSLKADGRSRVKINCNCIGDAVNLDLYRRGSDELVAQGVSTLDVDVEGGEYEVRARTVAKGPARGALKTEVHAFDPGATFEKQEGRRKRP